MEGRSPGRESNGRRRRRRPSDGRDFLRRFVDSEILTLELQDWLEEESGPSWEPPFELSELQSFDYAVEGADFQQLIRMPSAAYASTSESIQATALLAMEDFLHASVKGLWDRFWPDHGPLPFSVACLHSSDPDLHPAEAAIAKGQLHGLCATAVFLNTTRQIAQLALVRPAIRHDRRPDRPSPAALGEALFFALRQLVAGALTAAEPPPGCFLLLADSQLGGVVQLGGPVQDLDVRAADPYRAAARWLRAQALVRVSPLDRIWNRVGNADWGDLGTLQALLATFRAMARLCGPPRRAVEDLAGLRGSRLIARRAERALSLDPAPPEEEEEEEEEEGPGEGTVVWLEDRGFALGRAVGAGVHAASPVGEPAAGEVFVYVGSADGQVDMERWYQVQRQARILRLIKERGGGGPHLPEVVGSGRARSGPAVLVTAPGGRTVGELVRGGEFSPGEAVRLCRDCLAALAAAAGCGVRHGDVRPETVARARGVGYVVHGWGRAVVEERDRPGMDVGFSSTGALVEGRMCAAGDAESVVYLVEWAVGGGCPEVGSVEEALRWREAAWGRRVIQRRLGEVSPVLKGFADYVDSLCGTPYPFDYAIWIRRLTRLLPDPPLESSPP
ncbi:protein kinase superfamily protein [Wolffia australiana]